MLKKKSIVYIAVILIFVSAIMFITRDKLKKEPFTFEQATQGDMATITSYADLGDVHKALNVIYSSFSEEEMTEEELEKALLAVRSELEGAGKYYLRRTHIGVTDEEGITLGAHPNRNQIGGGSDYTDAITKGDYTVTTAKELIEAANKAISGDVIYIQEDTIIDLTGYMFDSNFVLTLNDGVTLAGDRNSSVIKSDAALWQPMIKAGNSVRITGIVLKGPDGTTRNREEDTLTTGIFTEENKLTVDNCEISGFSGNAIEIAGGTNHKVTHNFIHHNRTPLSKGIFVHNEANADIQYNLFNFNTYSIFAEDIGNVQISNNVELGTIYDTSISIKGDFNLVNIFSNTFLIDNETKEEVLINAPDGIVEFDNHIDRSNDENLFNTYVGSFTKDMLLTNVTGRLFYGDTTKVLKAINKVNARNKESALENLEEAINEIEQYTNYYRYKKDGFSFEIDGVVYGAEPDDNPIGGGFGYNDIFTDGDYVVENYEQFIDALKKAKIGEVIFIKGETVIDITLHGETIVIPDGVTLAGERGNNSSYGATIQCDSYSFNPLFKPGKNVRITGLNFKGQDPERRNDWYDACLRGEDQLGRSTFYKFITTDAIIGNEDNLEVDNCEFAGFSHAAIYITGGTGHKFHHNFIHHNQRLGLGYGVCMNRGVADINHNLMNYNRHDIAGTGAPGTSYTAHNNIQMGEATSHNFDMHGGADRNDGTDIAGDFVIMYNNTFLGNQNPYLLRGTPTEKQEFYHNALFMPFNHYRNLYGTGEEQRSKIFTFDNLFNIRREPTVVE